MPFSLEFKPSYLFINVYTLVLYLSQYLHSDIMDGSFRYKPPLFIDLTKTSKIKGANRQLMPYSYPERRYQQQDIAKPREKGLHSSASVYNHIHRHLTLNILLFSERQFPVSNNNKVTCIINVIMAFLALSAKNMHKRGLLKVGESISQK